MSFRKDRKSGFYIFRVYAFKGIIFYETIMFKTKSLKGIILCERHVTDEKIIDIKT